MWEGYTEVNNIKGLAPMSTLLEATTCEKLLPLFVDLSDKGIKVTVISDRLKVEGEYSDEIVRRLKEAKQDILGMLKSKRLKKDGPWVLSTFRVPSQRASDDVDLWIAARNEEACAVWYLGVLMGAGL